MKPSKTLGKLRAGKAVTCTKINLEDTRTVEIAALAGFDCIWSDMEHVPNGIGVIEKQVLACKAHDADSLVRVARGGYSDYIRPFEMGATGIMVPHLMGLEDAKQVVRMTRFHPIGRRPLDGGNSDGDFTAAELGEYIYHANHECMLVVQIEDPEPLSELDAIAALEGIDMLFFGPGDFSHSLGVPGCFDDPRLLDARKRVAEAALRHGKFAGTVASPDNAPDLLDMGYRFLSVGADVLALTQYFSLQLSEMQKIYAGKLG